MHTTQERHLAGVILLEGYCRIDSHPTWKFSYQVCFLLTYLTALRSRQSKSIPLSSFLAATPPSSPRSPPPSVSTLHPTIETFQFSSHMEIFVPSLFSAWPIRLHSFQTMESIPPPCAWPALRSPSLSPLPSTIEIHTLHRNRYTYITLVFCMTYPAALVPDNRVNTTAFVSSLRPSHHPR